MTLFIFCSVIVSYLAGSMILRRKFKMLLSKAYQDIDTQKRAMIWLPGGIRILRDDLLREEFRSVRPFIQKLIVCRRALSYLTITMYSLLAGMISLVLIFGE